jgi:hypothetical protein
VNEAGVVVFWRELTGSDADAVVSFAIPGGTSALTAYEYCNLHGVWASAQATGACALCDSCSVVQALPSLSPLVEATLPTAGGSENPDTLEASLGSIQIEANLKLDWNIVGSLTDASTLPAGHRQLKGLLKGISAASDGPGEDSFETPEPQLRTFDVKFRLELKHSGGKGGAWLGMALSKKGLMIDPMQASLAVIASPDSRKLQRYELRSRNPSGVVLVDPTSSSSTAFTVAPEAAAKLSIVKDAMYSYDAGTDTSVISYIESSAALELYQEASGKVNIIIAHGDSGHSQVVVSLAGI